MKHVGGNTGNTGLQNIIVNSKIGRLEGGGGRALAEGSTTIKSPKQKAFISS